MVIFIQMEAVIGKFLSSGIAEQGGSGIEPWSRSSILEIGYFAERSLEQPFIQILVIVSN